MTAKAPTPLTPLATAVAVMALVAATLAVNTASFDYGFVHDDNAVVLEREPAWEQGWLEFSKTRHWGLGRHVALLSLDLDRREPLSPRTFHLTNTALAGLVSILVWALGLALGLGRPASLAAGLLFAVHPLHVDAVVSIVGRAELLAALAVLAVLILHLKEYPRRALSLPLAAVLFFGGLASKESAICLLLLIAMADLAILKPGLRKALPTYAAYAAALGLWVLWTYPALGSMAPVAYVDNPLAFAPWWQRIPMAAELLFRYVALTLWPTDLVSDRSYATLAPGLASGLAAVGAWAALKALTLSVYKKKPALALLLLWFPVCFVATANVFFPIGTIMAERLAYLPSVGICLLAGLGLGWVSRQGRVLKAGVWTLFAVAVLTLSFGYISRARVWTSEDHFHAQTAVDSPRSAKAHFNLGQHLARRDRPEDAEKALARALAIYPAFDQAAYYRSALLLKLDRPYEAEGVWKSYLAYKPEDAGALSHLLGILVSVERYDEAIPLTQRLILLVPENNDFRSLLVRLEMMSDYQRGLEPLSP